MVAQNEMKQIRDAQMARFSYCLVPPPNHQIEYCLNSTHRRVPDTLCARGAAANMIVDGKDRRHVRPELLWHGAQFRARRLNFPVGMV